ncbi:hypothetical protein [Intestinibacter sp.]
MKLNEMGTKVYRGLNAPIKMNLEYLKQNQLHELTINDACGHHHGDGGCGHH